jgi:hypothetical protein
MSHSKNIVALALVIMLCVPFALLQSGASESPLRMRIDLSTSYASYIGEVANDNSGFSFAISGDVNGDGFDDLLIGANLNDDGGADAGKVYLFFGNSTGWAMDIDLSNSNASFVGEDGLDYAGYAVAIAGDVNHDGFDDILIGAPGDDDGGADAGQVYLILGKATGWANNVDLSGVSASFWGEDLGDAAGTSVAGAGDVNADGYDDIIIGAINDDDGGANAGQAYLILGKTVWAMDADLSASSASFWGEDAADIAGRSVAGAKDVNRDGYDDILVGAPGDDDGGMGAGQAYLILGKPTGWAMDTDLSVVDASFWGESLGDNSAYAVSSAGDINGDGYDDILIPANQDDDGGVNAGQSYIFLGKATGWAMDTDDSAADASFWGESAGDDAGRYVAPAGDVNGDGYDDFLIGAPQDDDGGNAAGQTYLILGKAAGWVQDADLSTADASYIGEDAGDFAGICVAGDGDVNGDGLDDILIGAYSDDDGGNNAGQTYLIMVDLTPPPPTGLKASLTGDGGPITLNWAKPEYWREPFSGFRVYRSMDGDNYDLLRSVSPSTLSYVDKKVELGKVYYYAVETVDASGDLSGLSKTVSQMCDNDTDLDGIGNLFDLDDDGDGVPDGQDDFPLDDKESLDTDLDGIGNNADADDDNDGIIDALDAEPLNPLNSLQDEMDLLSTTLQDVRDIVLDISANLTLMNSTLLGLDANVTSMNLSLTGMMTGLHDDMVGMNSTLLAAMAGMNSSVLNALSQVNSSVLNRLSQVNSSVHSALSGVNSTLLTALSGLNASLRAELVGMNASILAQLAQTNSSLYNALMGHNATVLAALAGLNDTVLAELGTVRSDVLAELAGVNSTILSELSGMNTSILTGLSGANSSLHSHLNAVNSSLSALIKDVHNDLIGVNGSLTTKLTAINTSISKVSKDLTGLNLTLRADHKELKDLLGKINTNLTWLMNNMVGGDDTKVLSAIANLSAQLSGTNASLQQSVVDLEVNLDADIQALQHSIDATNLSLNAQMTALDADMAAFRGNVTDGLNEIIGLIKDLDLNTSGGQGTNVSKEITKLQTLVENINSTTLTQISNQLDEIQRTMPGSGGDPQNISLILTKVTTLSTRLDVFRTETLTRLDNITKLLKALDQINGMASDIDNITKELVSMKADLERLNTIESDLAGLKKDIEKVKDEETKTRNAVSVSSTGTPIAIILLLVLVMVMMALNILRTRDLKAQGASTKKRMDEGFAEIGALKTVTYGMTQRVEELANRPIPEPQIRYIERPAEPAAPAQAPEAANEGAIEVAPEAQPESPMEPRAMEAQEAEQEIGPKDSKDQVGQHGEPSIDVILKKLKKHKK